MLYCSKERKNQTCVDSLPLETAQDLLNICWQILKQYSKVINIQTNAEKYKNRHFVDNKGKLYLM